MQITLGIVDDNGRRDLIVSAESVDNVETCIETGGLVESVTIGHTVDITLAVGFLEGVAIVDHGAEHAPFHDREVLVYALFEDGVLTVLVLAGNIFLLFEFGELLHQVVLLGVDAVDEGENLVVLDAG